MPLIDIVERKTKDSSGTLQYEDYTGAVTEALKRYSKHRPYWKVADITGNGGHDYPLPADWSEGLSAAQGIEYPVGNIPETILDAADWKLYATPTGKKLRLITSTPKATETFRLVYSTLHASERTVPAADIEAVANLAASICLRQLAAKYGQTSDPTINADVVNYRSKCDEFRRLADSLEALYKEHLGLKESDTTPAAMATAPAPKRDRVRLTHR